MTVVSRPARVFFPCTGLGRERRGFEAFTRECAAALRANPNLEITVFGGGGDLEPGERKLWSLSRAGAAARGIGALAQRDPYFVEQLSFVPGFVRALTLHKPDLVYFADVNLGNACWHWRRLTKQRFRLLYYNGGPTTRPFTRCDLVQQVSPEHYDSATARGESADRQVLLPHGVRIEREFRPITPAERARRRAQMGIPADAQVVLSVGALNASHKRMDYVIDEVASAASKPYLVLVGAETPETPALRALAADRLPGRCTMLSLSHAETRAIYPLADAFVLGSLVEGFGLAQVEALAAGLPCIAHETATSAYVLGTHGLTGDLRLPGMLAPKIDRTLRDAGSRDDRRAAARHADAYRRFSWDVLAPHYSALLIAVAEGRRPEAPSI